jgi:flagellar basal body-associated protein FliL
MAEPKKRGPLFWVILAVVAAVAILGVVMVGVGYFVTKQTVGTVSTANSDYAALKLLTLSNPNLEILKERPEKLEILVRDKQTREYSLRRADAKTKVMLSIPVPPDQLAEMMR